MFGPELEKLVVNTLLRAAAIILVAGICIGALIVWVL